MIVDKQMRIVILQFQAYIYTLGLVRYYNDLFV